MSRSRLLLCVVALLSLAAPALAATLDDIRQRGTIRIGVRQDARPFSYRNDLGEPAGYTVELCRAIAARLKAANDLPELKVEYVTVTAEDRFDAVKEGRIGRLTATVVEGVVSLEEPDTIGEAELRLGAKAQFSLSNATRLDQLRIVPLDATD